MTTGNQPKINIHAVSGGATPVANPLPGPDGVGDSPDDGATQPPALTLHRLAPRNVRHRWTRTVLHHGALVAADVLSLAAVAWAYRLAHDGALGNAIAEMVAVMVTRGRVGFWEFAAALFLALWVTGNYGYGDSRREPARLLGGAALAAGLVLWSVFWTQDPLVVGEQYLAVTLGVWFALMVDRVMVDLVLQQFAPESLIAPRTVFVGNQRDCEDLHARRILGWDRDYTHLGFIDPSTKGAQGALGQLAQLTDVLDRLKVQWVVICSHLQDQTLERVLDSAAATGCKAFAAPGWLVNGSVAPGVVWRRGHQLLELTPPSKVPLRDALDHAPSGFYLKVGKRMLDIVGAAVGIVLGILPVSIAALAMLLESRGPVFILQPRVGRGGRIFEILKLRTMVPDAERDGGAQWTIAKDPRITPVGRWIRRLRIDEFPQFVNVLVGQMSLIGPRPERPELHDQIVQHHPPFHTRVAVKPGISGSAQILDGYADSIKSSLAKLDHDRRYIASVSLGVDLVLLAKTVKVVLTGHGSR